MAKQNFKIGDDVEFYGCHGKIVEFLSLPNDLKIYKVSFAAGEGDIRTSQFYDFEMCKASRNSIGFGKTNNAE